jgi:hypothetical protein
MQGFLRKHAIGLLALFVAIGGTSFAAAKLTGRDFKPDSITGKQVDESKLKVTRIVARPSGDQDVVADPPPGGPPEDPANAGVRYALKPSSFKLRSAGILEVHGDLRAELVEGCSNGFVSAFVYVDGELTTQGGLPLPPPTGGPSIPVFVSTAPQEVGRGRHRVEVRVSSSCSVPGGGPAGEITSIDLSLVAHQ